MRNPFRDARWELSQRAANLFAKIARETKPAAKAAMAATDPYLVKGLTKALTLANRLRARK